MPAGIIFRNVSFWKENQTKQLKQFANYHSSKVKLFVALNYCESLYPSNGGHPLG